MAEVTVHLNTKDRPEYATIMLSSLFAQTFHDWDLIVSDASAAPCVEHEHFGRMLDVIGREHNVIYGRDEGLGIPQTYEKMRQASNSPFCCREEDDIFWEGDCLEILMQHARQEGVGAVAPSTPDWQYSTAPFVLDDPVPGQLDFENGFLWDTRTKDVPGYPDGIWCADDAQRRWYPDANRNQAYEVCTLHGGGVYRTEAMGEAGGFSAHFTPVGHREETHAWCRLHLDGWNLLVAPAARVWHFEAMTGGSRTNLAGSPERRAMQIEDERRFQGDFAKWREADPSKFKMLEQTPAH